MPTIKLRFPGGRYHATPWGHHVNEGLIEWPPSPWRLLRALIACGFTSQGWSEFPSVARSLIEKLAAVLPRYRLPDASAAHSRHFMPIGSLKDGREQTTLVFDTWANVGTDELLIHWPCELDVEELELLGKLATSLGYLGRSESWVEAQLTDEVPAEWNAVPCVEHEHRGPGWEQVSLMAAIHEGSYQNWRDEITTPFREAITQKEIPLPGGKKKPTEKQLAAYQEKLKTAKAEHDVKLAGALEPYPPDLLSCLTKDTAWWKGHGWSQPPGSRRVLYWRRSDALQIAVPTIRKPPEPEPIEWMLLALSTPSGNQSALPHQHRTLPQAEHLRRALICLAADGKRIRCPSLLGKDEHGPIHDQHYHAHFIPFCANDQKRIDHILVYAKGKLCGTAQRAIRKLKRTWTKGGVGELQLALVGQGNFQDLYRLPDNLKKPVEEIVGPSEGAIIWVSMTPFVPPRFLKAKGKDTLEGQVQAELASRKLPPAEIIEVDRELTKNLRHFVRRRLHGGVPPKVDAGYGLCLRFAELIRGPLLLGYASHYGLGLFSACASQINRQDQI